MQLPPPITSRSNARVKALRAGLSGAPRRLGDLLGLEGPNLIREAHMAGMSFEVVYVRQGSETVLSTHERNALRTKEWAVLSREVFDRVVSTGAPQGVAATWVIQEPQNGKSEFRPGLIAENLQDPGNLGTLIRSATAFGVGDVVVTPETVNAWNPKVVRAAAGAAFHTRVRRMPLREAVSQLRSDGVRVFAGVSSFFGGPEHGPPVLAAPHGVLTGRLVNREAPESLRYKEHPWDAYAETKHSYPASFSYDTDFAEPCAIMIGNEGAGLTLEARMLADEEVMIPCGVESLNAAVAGSVLMYEVMRQRTLRAWARRQGLRP